MSVLSEKLSHARSLLVTVPLIVAATAIMGSLSLVSSLADSKGKLQHASARFWGRLILKISGVTVTVFGNPQIEDGSTYVFCVNHQSHMDIPVVLAALSVPFRFAAKKELFQIPFLGWHLRRSGHIAIDRENPRKAIQSFRGASRKLLDGVSLVFFPEGGTSFDGSIKPFKGGGFRLAEQSKIAVVPVTIRGSRAVLLPKTRHIRGGHVEVTLGEPIPSEMYAPKDMAVRVREEIVATFERRQKEA